MGQIKATLTYPQKRAVETLILGALEPLPEGHTPELGCAYLSGFSDARVAREATVSLDVAVTLIHVANIRRGMFGDLNIRTERGLDLKTRLAKVEAAAEDWLAFEGKLRALLVEHGFITEDW